MTNDRLLMYLVVCHLAVLQAFLIDKVLYILIRFNIQGSYKLLKDGELF